MGKIIYSLRISFIDLPVNVISDNRGESIIENCFFGFNWITQGGHVNYYYL